MMSANHKMPTADAELIDVLTAISTVSMRLAVRLEMLNASKGRDFHYGDQNNGCSNSRRKHIGGYTREAL